MKKIKISGYLLAIVLVEQSLHITASTQNYSEISLKEFNENKEVKLQIYNEFTEKFSKLPEDWNARNVACHKNQIILILK
jgi:hypothetical protein